MEIAEKNAPNAMIIQRLRVALVAPQVFPLPPREGFATAVEFLIQELSEVLSLRHDTTICSVADRSTVDGYTGGISYQYTPVTAIDARLLPFLYRMARHVLRRDLNYWQSSGYFSLYAARLALKIRRSRFDVVHLFNILQFAPWIRRLSPASRIVFHITWHGLSKEVDYFGYSTLRSELAERCLKDVDAVIACSDYLLNGIRKRFPSQAQKLFRVYNGVKVADCHVQGSSVDQNGHQSKKTDLVVIFGGRIVPEKGLHNLLKAMHLVVKRVPQARLSVVGVSWRPGAEFSDYWRELERLIGGLEQRVEFQGWKSRAEFPRVLADADVYAFPSIWEEPFSMALLEAMAAGLPVVATATGGTPELVEDGVNGFLVGPEDHETMAERITTLLTNLELRKRMGRRGQRLVIKRFRWDHIVDELLGVYGEVSERTNRTAGASRVAARQGGG